jgi:hypothetical protein
MLASGRYGSRFCTTLHVRPGYVSGQRFHDQLPGLKNGCNHTDRLTGTWLKRGDNETLNFTTGRSSAELKAG